MNAAAAYEVISVDESADVESISDDRSFLTQSLKSSILQGVKENGRSYHRYKGVSSANDYPIPDDELEQERLELQHQLFTMIFNGNLNLAPLEGDPEHVLDLGTGTGTWAMQAGHCTLDDSCR